MHRFLSFPYDPFGSTHKIIIIFCRSLILQRHPYIPFIPLFSLHSGVCRTNLMLCSCSCSFIKEHALSSLYVLCVSACTYESMSLRCCHIANIILLTIIDWLPGWCKFLTMLMKINCSLSMAQKLVFIVLPLLWSFLFRNNTNNIARYAWFFGISVPFLKEIWRSYDFSHANCSACLCIYLFMLDLKGSRTRWWRSLRILWRALFNSFERKMSLSFYYFIVFSFWIAINLIIFHRVQL